MDLLVFWACCAAAWFGWIMALDGSSSAAASVFIGMYLGTLLLLITAGGLVWTGYRLAFGVI